MAALSLRHLCTHSHMMSGVALFPVQVAVVDVEARRRVRSRKDGLDGVDGRRKDGAVAATCLPGTLEIVLVYAIVPGTTV
jgi:hypothetical protein